MFLTRIGFGSKVVVTGDATQKDLALSTTLSLITTQQALLASQAELFKALGSGWDTSMLLEEK